MVHTQTAIQTKSAKINNFSKKSIYAALTPKRKGTLLPPKMAPSQSLLSHYLVPLSKDNYCLDFMVIHFFLSFTY